MIANFDVLGLGMKGWVGCQRYCLDIIIEQYKGSEEEQFLDHERACETMKFQQ